MNEVPLESVIEELELEYDLQFSFKQEILTDILISAKVNEKNVNSFLAALFQSSIIEYNLLDEKYVVLFLGEEKIYSSINFCGNIYDSENRQPLGFANVYLKNQNIGTESRLDGSFELQVLKKTKDSIYVSYLGYKTITFSTNECQEGSCLDIYMEPTSIGQTYVVVLDYLGSGISLENNGLSTKINPRIMGSLPGEVEPDILKTIQLLPGVSSPSSRVSDLHIRGCTPDQNLLTWEDIPMYHSAHYFGMISAINPFIIKEAKVYRSGFSADYGGRIASVIDLKSTKENQPKAYLGVGSNMTHAYVYGNQYMNATNNTSVTFSLRRSYTEILKTPTIKNITTINQQGFILGNREVESLPDHIQVEDEINFFDGNVKLSTKLNKKNRLSLSALIAENNFSDKIIDSVREEIQSDTMKLESKGANLKLESRYSKKFKSILKTSYSSYFYSYVYLLNEINGASSKLSGLKYNKIEDKQLQISGQYTGKNKQELEVGYHLINYFLDFEIKEDEKNNPYSEKNRSKANLHSIYASFKNPLTHKLGINVGARLSYFNELEQFFFEPRVNLSYKINELLSFHGNYGKHNQFVYQLVEFKGNENGINFPLWYLSGNRNDPVQSASVYQLGIVLEQKGLVVDLQGYIRDIKGLSSRSFDFSAVPEGSNFVGSSEVIGLDIMIKKRFRFLKSWLSYSLSKTEFNFPTIQETNFPSDYDQRHILQWTNQIAFDRFDVGLAYQYASGLPYSLMTGFRPEGSPNPNPNANPQFIEIYDGINNYNLNATHELNFSINYNFKASKKGMKAYLGFSILNVLDKENLYNRTFIIDQTRINPPYIKTIDKTKLRQTANLSFRMEWGRIKSSTNNLVY